MSKVVCEGAVAARNPGEARSRAAGLLKLAERLVWPIGLGCLLCWVALSARGMVGERHELQRFAALRGGATRPEAPDQSLWSPERVRAWQRASNDEAPAPLAVLRIPRLRIEVPVLDGTDDATLDRAVGRIAETALPGTDGNSGIAGHRDGFFRGLKDGAIGDVVELETLRGKETYQVERIWIVAPEDVSVLDPTPVRSLTLVTCYPFYFVGSAPQRYVVRAVRRASNASPSVASAR